MMFYNPHSYEDIKAQLAERRIELERLRRADAMERGRQGALRPLASRVGGVLIRFGTWLAQPGQTIEQVSS
jgi:hypothetical protein